MINIHIGILTMLVPEVIFCLSQAKETEDQPRICISLSYIVPMVNGSLGTHKIFQHYGESY